MRFVLRRKEKVYKCTYDKHKFHTDRRGKNKYKFIDSYGYGFKLKSETLQYFKQVQIFQIIGTYFTRKRFEKFKDLGKVIYQHPYN